MKALVALLAVFALSSAAEAEHCTTYSTTTPNVGCGMYNYEGTYPYYVDEDCCDPCLSSIWVYDESNGIPGLQRGDEVHDDTCHGMIIPDTIVF